MPAVERLDDKVDVGCDDKFEDKWWRFERVMWLVLSVIILAGIGGAFGRGPFSKVKHSIAGLPVTVEYEKVMRFETPGKIKVMVTRVVMPEGDKEFRLWMNRSLVQTLKIQDTLPVPLRIESMENGVFFYFSADPGAGWAEIVFTQQPGKYGFLKGEIGSADTPTLSMSQLIFP